MLELAFERIEGARPRKTIAFLHGILGSGGNLRTIARRFVDARPSWTAWLVDLRGHGRSPKGTPDPSLEAAARDVVGLTARAAQPASCSRKKSCTIDETFRSESAERMRPSTYSVSSVF